jgi:hypothetical protein
METHNVKRISLADYTVRSSAEKTDRSGWVNYGVDNLFPQYLSELAATGAVHGSLCISIGDMFAGKGLEAGVYNSRLEALSAYDVFYGCAHDYKKYGGYYIEVIYSIDRQNIAKIRHLPFEECRIAVTNEEEEIVGVYHSNDWANTRKKRNKPEFLPVFNPTNNAEEPRQIFYKFAYCGANIYPRPDYYSAINSIELAREISVYHVNNIMNGLSPSMIVSLFQGAPAPDEQQQIKRDWERELTGARNAGKFIMTFNERDTPKPDITTFPLSDADKQYEFLSKESTSLIMVAHRVVTPLLFGIRDVGGGFGSNKDEMAVGLQIFTNQVVDPAQRKLASGLEEILSYEMPNISITVIPNSPLTNAGEIAVNTPSAQVPPSSAPVMAEDEKKKFCNCENLADSFEPTNEMKTAAELGLKWRAEYNRGGTEVGVARARDISNGRNLSIETITRMNSYFARHAVDKEASGWNQGEEGFPSAGRIAWELWGGDAGRDWAARMAQRIERENLSSQIAEELIALGEDAPEGFILIDSYEVDYENDDAENEELVKITAHELASTGSAKPMKPSDQDETNYAGVTFMTRYRYKGRATTEREFCKKMIAADKLYRKEDIEAMEDKAVNRGWGPYGTDYYSIWLYKGGGNCYHFWQKEVYINAKGINPLANDSQKIAVKKAERMGYTVRNDIRVALLPVDQDFNGFLETNPVYGKDGKNYRR